MPLRKAVILVATLLAMLLPIWGQDTALSYTTLDFPTGLNTGLFGINDSGQISGTFFDKKGVAHALLYSKGEFKQIDFPDADRTFGFGMNGSANIVGYYINPDGNTHGFMVADGKFVKIDFPKATVTRAFGINNAEQIVGTYSDDNDRWHAFLLDKGKFDSLDVPDATRTEAYGINNKGDIVGFYWDSKSVVHGFVKENKNFTTIDRPGSVRTSLYGINLSGQICGTATDSNGPYGFIEHGAKAKLRFPGTTLSTFGFAMNDAGDVVGQYVDVDSVVHGYRVVAGDKQLPQISARLDPLNIPAGLPGFQLDVRGVAFTPESVVYWNGTARPTKFVSRLELYSAIPAGDIAKPGVALIKVVNPGPNGGASNEVQYEIVGKNNP